MLGQEPGGHSGEMQEILPARHTQMVQFPSDGVKTSPSMWTTPLFRQPGSCSSGTPALSSEHPAPWEPHGASREEPTWESQGGARWCREGREEWMCPVLRRGGEERGEGGVHQLREGVG